MKFSFLVDTAADETFLHHRSIAIPGTDSSHIEVRNDVGGVGRFGTPYFLWETKLKPVILGGHIFRTKGFIKEVQRYSLETW